MANIPINPPIVPHEFEHLVDKKFLYPYGKYRPVYYLPNFHRAEEVSRLALREYPDTKVVCATTAVGRFWCLRKWPGMKGKILYAHPEDRSPVGTNKWTGCMKLLDVDLGVFPDFPTFHVVWADAWIPERWWKTVTVQHLKIIKEVDNA